nr:hypothetical protein [Candidatus Sigynarchaeota archaeon]
MQTVRKSEALVAVVLGVAALVAGIQLTNPVNGAITPAGTITTSAVNVSAGWNRTWGGTANEFGMGVWSNGSSFYTCGNTYSFGAGITDLVLVKWNGNGDQVWNKTWGDANANIGNSVWGSGTAIYTCGYSFVVSKYELLLVKWDNDGNQIWNRTFGGSLPSNGRSVWTDGTSIYTGGELDNGSNYLDVLLVKWDADGNQLWNSTWGGTGYDFCNSVRGNGTTDIYTCGSTASFGAEGSSDFLLVKWDTDGNQIWNRTWGYGGGDEAYSLWIDGPSIYVCGTGYWGYDYYYGTTTDIVLLKYRVNGGLSFNVTYGGNASDAANAVVSTSSAIYTFGYTSINDSNEFILVQWDLAGNPLGNITWGGTGADNGNALWTDGTSIFACGDTDSFGAGGSDMAIFKWTLPSTVLGIDLVPFLVLAAVSAIAFLAIKLERARGVS